MKKIILVLFCLVVSGVFTINADAASGINRKINFQGKVVNKAVGATDGTNVADGDYDMKFSVWSTASAGTSLWTEVWNSGTTQVAVQSGIFSVALGSYATFPPAVDFNSDSLYVSVDFNHDGEMTPRVNMTAVPYAFNAEKVGGLTVTSTTGTLTIGDGTTVAFGGSFTTMGVGISLNQNLNTTAAPTFGGLNIGGSSVFTNLSVGGTLKLTGMNIGTGTTILYIDSAGNLVSGTLPSTGSGQSKVITLSPEFAGASLSADGSGTTAVSMTSDNSLNAGGAGWKNYYEVSSSNASLQDYSVLVRVTLPADFSTWETGNCPGATCALEMNYQTGVGTVADNYLSFAVNNDTDTPGTAVCSIGQTASTGWSTSGCAEATLNDNSAPEWDAAGETAVVRIKMAAKNTSSALARMGDIVLRYKAKF